MNSAPTSHEESSTNIALAPAGTKPILIVEDDHDIAAIVSGRLEQEGYRCICEYSGTDAESFLRHQIPVMLICDLMLPGCSGEDVIRLARGLSNSLPVLVISARGSTRDKVALLSLGADDYLAKPFDVEELVARAAVQMRHQTGNAAVNQNQVEYGKWRVNTQERTFEVDGSPIVLTNIEFNIVALLVRHPSRVYTRPEIFSAAWGQDYADDANTVNVHISNIRNKLKPTGTDKYIQTVWGVGFKLTLPVSK